MFRPIHWMSILSAAAAFLASVTARADTPGCSAAGPLPPALPPHMLLGWGVEGYDDTWAKGSGTKYDVQWTYLSGQAGNNWYNDFGGGAADGSLLDDIFSTIDGYGFIPGIHLYNVGYGHDGGDSGILTEIQDASWTKEYFTEFKVMMQKAKTYGKPVVIVLEGDSFGFLENLTSNDSSVSAAVASTGLPELASLPNTVAGFGQAYLALRKSVGATNVAMGPDTPYYASGGDIMNWPPSDTQALQPFVDYQWSFFGPLGVGANTTGDRFDFSASCPRDSDQDSYDDGRDVWSTSDTASVDTPSINRYIEWLTLYNQTSGARWMLHQVPIGNSQLLDQPWSASVSRSGYKDTLVEHLFQVESPASTALRDQHLTAFANAGVVGMLFGFSNDGNMPTNDLWLDGKPFFNTHVALVANSGGFAIAGSGDCSGATDGGSGSGSGSSSGSGGGSSSGSGGGSSSGSGSGSGSGSQADGGTSGGSSRGVGPAGDAGGSGAGNEDAPGEGGRSGGCGCWLAGAPATSEWLGWTAVAPWLLARRRRGSRSRGALPQKRV